MSGRDDTNTGRVVLGRRHADALPWSVRVELEGQEYAVTHPFDATSKDRRGGIVGAVTGRLRSAWRAVFGQRVHEALVQEIGAALPESALPALRRLTEGELIGLHHEIRAAVDAWMGEQRLRTTQRMRAIIGDAAAMASAAARPGEAGRAGQGGRRSTGMMTLRPGDALPAELTNGRAVRVGVPGESLRFGGATGQEGGR